MWIKWNYVYVNPLLTTLWRLPTICRIKSTVLFAGKSCLLSPLVPGSVPWAVSCWSLLPAGLVTVTSWLFLEHTKDMPPSTPSDIVFSTSFLFCSYLPPQSTSPFKSSSLLPSPAPFPSSALFLHRIFLKLYVHFFNCLLFAACTKV